MSEDRGSSTQRGYGYKWQQAREGYLAKHPFCVKCERLNKLVAATVVDHITPHKGDMKLFWDRKNWQGLCKPCHDSDKKIEESKGVAPGSDATGIPLDPNHHWNKTKA